MIDIVTLENAITVLTKLRTTLTHRTTIELPTYHVDMEKVGDTLVVKANSFRISVGEVVTNPPSDDYIEWGFVDEPKGGQDES